MKKFHNLSNDYLFKNVFYNHHYLSMLLQDLFQFNIKDYDYTPPVLPKENYYKADGKCDLVFKKQIQYYSCGNTKSKSGKFRKQNFSLCI